MIRAIKQKIDMIRKVVILAGGLGTRLSEETITRPKPMIEIGGKPILWHIMKIYSAYGLNDFIICCGYKGYLIKEYFANYFMHSSDVTFDLLKNETFIHERKVEPWRVTLVETGENTGTGGRLKKIGQYLEGESSFCFTYGDGVADIDVGALISFHDKHRLMATVSAVTPPARFGALVLDNDHVERFVEKPAEEGGRINGGFFVLNKNVFDLLDANTSSFEDDVLSKLAVKGQLAGFKHNGFWHPMDTMRDKVLLNRLWETGSAPWKVWD